MLQDGRDVEEGSSSHWDGRGLRIQGMDGWAESGLIVERMSFWFIYLAGPWLVPSSLQAFLSPTDSADFLTPVELEPRALFFSSLVLDSPTS
jgi:hypothetical protein